MVTKRRTGAGSKSLQIVMSKKNKLQIVSVRIEHKADESPDLSFLGELTDSPESGAIIRIGEHAGKFVSELSEDDCLPERCREYRFFVPAMTGDQTGNPESPKQDFERMEAYNRGDWQMLGIIAKAEIFNPVTNCTQTIRSGGLWGVESDGGEYLKEVAKEQLSELQAELQALNGGIGERAIAYAINNCEI